jgi:hypothetical protein
MSDTQSGAEWARLSERMDHLVSAVDKMFTKLESLESRFVRKDDHEFKVSSLEARVKRIEEDRDQERKDGGFLGGKKTREVAWTITAVLAAMAALSMLFKSLPLIK